MKPKGLMFGVVAVLVVTALTAGVATAQSQDGTQQIQSSNATMPIDVANSSPTDINANYDTGHKISTFMAGQSDNNSSQQGADPQRKQARDRSTPATNNPAAPAEVAPRGGNSVNPGGSGPGTPTNPTGRDPGPIMELPKTGGTKIPTLGIVGLLLVAGGLVVRKALR